MDIGKIGLRKHHIKALIEADVTASRNKIKHIRAKQGVKLSFTSWLLKCIGQAIYENKQVQAMRKGKSRLVIFDNVDISIMVEKMVEGVRVPIPLVIRDVNKKSAIEINNEIEYAREQDINDGTSFVLGKKRNKEPAKLFSLLPQFIRLFIWKIILSDPFRVQKMMGTAIVTSVGMMGNIKGWVIPSSIHSVCFAIGSIVRKPGALKDKIEIREYLEMTILIDHDVMDGAPAARFVSRLTDLIEKGYDL